MIEVTTKIIELTERLQKSQSILFRLAREKAETERVYRMELSKEILRLRADGIPVAIIGDIARGKCSELKFERDFKESAFKAAIEAVETIKTQINALQSILKYQSDI